MFTKIIKSLNKYKNNVYLSATIDEINNFTYYKKYIRDMIDNKYLCDYTIHIPIFSDDPSNKNICKHLLQNYRNIIIYCNSQKEGKKINNLLNLLQNKSSEYIDCNTPKIKRNKIIEKYKKGEIPFLVNVRILVEGFDAPITQGVCFVHLPSNKTTIIQIIGRALRLYTSKTFANIILPFSSKEDESNISKFLKILAQNDIRIKKSYESKKEGGYIFIEKIKDNEEDNKDKQNNNIEFRYDMIYDSMGILQNGEDVWMKKLEWVKKYIDDNNKRPSSEDINKEIKAYGHWVSHQKNYYIKNESIMKNEIIRNKWKIFINDDKYKQYFISNDDKWINTLETIKKYIEDENKLPTRYNKNKEIKQLGKWLSTQQQNYSKKEHLMIDQLIREKWELFINENEKYFLLNQKHTVKNKK